jgi:hypothetical protein
MSEPIQIVPEKIHIKSIKILGGSITSDSEAPPINKISSFDVQYGLKDELNFKAKTFRFIFSVSIEALDELNKTLGSKAQYSIEYIFSVDNIEYYITSVEKDSKTIVFHPVLPNTLMSIVYSTSRALFFPELKEQLSME